MKIAYVIHAYKLCEQFGKLIESLNDNDIYFFIHIDQQSNIDHFQKEIQNLKIENIYFVKRERSKWGSFSCVRGVLNALEKAIDIIPEIEYFYFLSGQDYPIKSNKFIKNYFFKNRHINFLLHFELPYKNWKAGGLHRLTRNHFYISKNRIIRRLVNLINFFLPRRKVPMNLKPYGGDFYMGLNIEAVTFIIKVRKAHPDFDMFFENVYIPEELYFPILLLNSGKLFNTELTFVNQTLTYTNWVRKYGSYPAILDLKDIEDKFNSEYLFVRKIDEGVHPNLITEIEKRRNEITF